MTYRLQQPVQFEEVIQKSRFLTHLLTIDNAEHALEEIKRLSAADASHNCWAFKAGSIYRFSDDGEPSGTAGRPMLAIIEGQQLDFVLALCTRWYGGTKLGTGGLIRAYSNGVKQCIAKAKILPYVAQSQIQGFCSYPLLDRIKAALKNFDADIMDEKFNAEGAELVLQLPESSSSECINFIERISNGEHQFKTVEK